MPPGSRERHTTTRGLQSTRKSDKSVGTSRENAGPGGQSPRSIGSTATRRPKEPKVAARRRTKHSPPAKTQEDLRPAAAAVPSKLLLVNMIPMALSAETNQDSEPHLTVNPANPQQIAATAFTPDPTGSTNAPVFVTQDGGRTWALNSIVPSVAGGATQDITTSFSGKGSRLYSGILRVPTSNLELLWTGDSFSQATMNIVSSQPNADQPFTVAATAAAGPVNGKEVVYIGINDFSAAGGQTATIEQCLDGAAAPPVFAPIRLEQRATSGQDGPQVRTAVCSDGTVYSAFYRWRSTTGNPSAGTFVVTSADVVLTRDDSWGSGLTPFSALTDPGDGVAGLRVVQGVAFQWMLNGTTATGQQRLGGCLSVAVDPNASGTVLLVYADRPPSSIHTLHLRRSTDRGLTWSADLLHIDNATNGAVAIDNNGNIGFLYQQYKPSRGHTRWTTVFTHSADGLNWTNLILADVPSDLPSKTFDPYLGDYCHLLSQNAAFCGVFSTSNIPDMNNFPNGVTFQRNADFSRKTLLRLDNATTVKTSIDPFFFSITV